MARDKMSIVTRIEWDRASRACSGAKSVGSCNKASIKVKESIDPKLGCEWTTFPDRVVNNEVTKKHVGKGLEAVGSFFVGKQNIRDSTCNVTAPDGMLVK